MASDASPGVLTIICLHCGETGAYRNTALHVYLLSNGVARLEFFCTACKQSNGQFINEVTGENLTSRFGVAVTFVHVPLEVVERQALALASAPITPADVAVLEDMTMPVFQYRMRRMADGK